MKNVCFKWYAFFSILIFYSLQVYAQHIPERFESVTNDPTALGTFIDGILQDSRGYLWIKSGDGLFKYDGYATKKYRYDPFDPNTISQNIIYTFWIDKSDTIWLGTPEGLCKFDPHTEKFTRYDSSLFPDMPNLGNVSAINEDNQGKLWIANYEGKLWRYDKDKRLFITMTSEFGLQTRSKVATNFHESTYCIYKDKKGNLWIGTSAGMYEVTIIPGKHSDDDNISFTHYQHSVADSNSLSSNHVRYIFEDHAGIIWIATGAGLNSFNPVTKKFTHVFLSASSSTFLSNSNFTWSRNTIVEDDNNALWIATGSGLLRLNKERTIFSSWYENQNSDYGLKSSQIYALGLDRGGNLLISTPKGLQRLMLNQKRFGLLQLNTQAKNSNNSNGVTGIAEDEMNNIWIGSYGGGVDKWNKRTGALTHYQHDSINSNSLKSNNVNDLLIDPDGNLYVCNQEYLSIMKKGADIFEHYNTNSRNLKDLDAITVYSICRDQDGLIWVGTGNGIKRFDPVTKKFTDYYYETGNPYGISDYTALSIFADSRGNIWVGTGSIAFNKFNKQTGRFTHYKNNALDSTSIPSNIVNAIYEDSKGNLWIGTDGGGLCQYNYRKDNFTTATRNKNLPWSIVYSIQEDKRGNLWIGTEKGLSRYAISTASFTNYDVNDGLQDNLFAAGYRSQGSSCKGKNGTLYFGGIKGLNYFDPAQIRPNNNIPPVVITQFKIFDKLQPGMNDTDRIVLNYDQNFFSFEFAALNYTNTSKNKYAYQLVGVDKDWIYCNDRRYVGYTNVDPGTYTFKVKASNNDGVWNEKGVAVKVIINPPWWRTWWAYAIYALIVVAGMVMVDRMQRRRVVAKEREQSRQKELLQAREIEKAYNQLKSTQAQLIQSEKMASLGQLTAGIAHEIQNPLNFVNNFSEINTELLDDLEEEVGRGNVEEVIAIAKDLKENEQKIIYHGKRADSIVKGMLQHSRASAGKKELTDINALVDECVRLSYHGLRAKDKEFDVAIKTELDGSIGKVDVMPQDISRVLLNLLNNAFYAVDEKKRQQNGMYEPAVAVCTKKLGGKVEIQVKDNGNGIPQNIVDKIFQPFFTTKPTGQGTGLGLSLSYDIIKAHGGEIRVESNEGEGSEFVILIPTN